MRKKKKKKRWRIASYIYSERSEREGEVDPTHHGPRGFTARVTAHRNRQRSSACTLSCGDSTLTTP